MEWKEKCEDCFPHMFRKNLQHAVKNLVTGKVSEVMLQGKRRDCGCENKLKQEEIKYPLLDKVIVP